MVLVQIWPNFGCVFAEKEDVDVEAVSTKREAAITDSDESEAEEKDEADSGTVEI